jgi:hypothetical protein
MSFLIDGPWLYATGRAYGRLMPEPTPAARAVSRATAGAFLATSISLYLDRKWTRRIWERCRADSGRDWMLNSGVLRIDHRRVGWRTHLLSAALFATYPAWLALGERAGRRGR